MTELEQIIEKVEALPEGRVLATQEHHPAPIYHGYPKDTGLTTDDLKRLASHAKAGQTERKAAVREFIEKVNSPLLLDIDFDDAASDVFKSMFNEDL